MCYFIEIDSVQCILIAVQDRGQPLNLKVSSPRAGISDALMSMTSIYSCDWDYGQALFYRFAVVFGKSPVLKSDFSWSYCNFGSLHSLKLYAVSKDAFKFSLKPVC